MATQPIWGNMSWMKNGDNENFKGYGYNENCLDLWLPRLGAWVGAEGRLEVWDHEMQTIIKQSATV